MQNNFMIIFFVPEIALTVLSMVALMYGLFIKKDSFIKTINFSILILVIISILIYFDFSTNFALFEDFFSNTSFTKFFKILTTLGAAASLIISKNYFLDTKISRFEIPNLLLFSTLKIKLESNSPKDH